MKKQSQIKVKTQIFSINLILFLFLSVKVAGQTDSNRFLLNLHAGLAGTQVEGDGLAGFDKLGFQAGLGIHTAINSNFDLGFEINLLQKGSIRRPNPEIGDYDAYKMALLYAQVPVFLRYNATPKLSFLAGPAIGFLLSAKESDFYGPIPTDPEFNRIEFSGILEIQYNLTQKISAGIRTDQSLLPIRSKGPTNSNRLIGRQYNSVLGLYIYFSMG